MKKNYQARKNDLMRSGRKTRVFVRWKVGRRGHSLGGGSCAMRSKNTKNYNESQW